MYIGSISVHILKKMIWAGGIDLKVALVDDEQIYLEQMEQLCQDFAKKQHYQLEIRLFRSGRAFLEAFEKELFSIVFMDIYMDEMDGISTALQMRNKDQHCLLVFLTASREFMPEAFSCHAFEYIVKPFSDSRITAVLEDALQILPPASKYMEIVSKRSSVPVFFQDIISAVTDAHYIEINLIDDTILRSRMTMSEFLQLTEGDPRFILINKGIVLNADHILNFEGNSCMMENGAKFPVRVREYQKIKQAVQNYHFEKIRSQQHFWLNS